MLVLSNYTLEEITQISSSVTTNVRGPIGTTSLEGLRGYLTALKIMTLFLATHTYPGYRSSDEEVLEYVEETSPVEISVSTVLESDSEEDDTMDDESFLNPEGKKRKIQLEGTGSGRNGVLTAKPSPLPPTVNFGFGSAAPSDLPGVTFPYFEGMLESDGSTFSRIVHHYFYRNFGESPVQCHANYVQWRRTVSDWIRTDAGRSISHVFFGIQLALESQTRLYVAYEDSRYLGFILFGGHFHVSSQGELTAPLVGLELRKEIRSMSQHALALEEIAAVLSKTPLLEGGELELVDVDMLQSSREMMKRIWKRKEFVGDELLTLKNAIGKVHFVKPAYLVPNIENLKRLITMMADPTSSTFDDEALYVNPGRLYMKDPKYIALAAFGPVAPSFFNAQGLAYSIVGTEMYDAANAEVEVNGRMEKSMRRLIMTMKPIEVAWEDWKSVMKDGSVRVNQQERAAPARTYVYQGENRDVLWDHFKKEIGQRRAEKMTADASRKRRRSEDESDAGERKRSSKATGEVFSILTF